MPDRNGPGSRWSSVSEREERERRRAAAREEAKRARLARESGERPVQESTGRRRLTDDERRTISQYRFPSSPGDSRAPAPAEVPDEPAVDRPTVGTRWRDSARAASSPVAGPSLPDLPGDRGAGRKRPANSRLLIFGLALFAVMALIAYLPFGPLGDNGRDPVPTPVSTLPSILDPDAGLDANAEATTQAEEPVASAGQAVVCIDPGHGGWDDGWNRTEGSDVGYGPPFVTEAELNLGMAYMLKARLEELGYFVILTRPSGAAVNMYFEDINGDGQTYLEVDETEDAEQTRDRDELQARINACNEADADILVSMHVNGFDQDRSTRGYEVVYTAEREFGEQNAELATLVYRRVDSTLRGTAMSDLGRGARPDTEVEIVRHEYGTARHYIMTGPAFEEGSIEPSEMPGVILEAGFLSNDQDAAWLVQPSNQQLLVDAYAQGIADYFERYPPAD